VWTENKDGKGATNFITGMGGYLQSILFGFGGLRLRDNSLDVDPVLPPGCTEMNFTGIDYLGSSLDMAVNTRYIIVTLTLENAKRELQIDNGVAIQRLLLNIPVQLRVGKATIKQSPKNAKI